MKNPKTKHDRKPSRTPPPPPARPLTETDLARVTGGTRGGITACDDWEAPVA